MQMKTLIRTAAMISPALLLLAASPSFAQDASTDDAAFDESLKGFGYTGGAAWQCAEGEAKAQFVVDASDIFNRLTQLFGTDRAFYFAAAFGAGSVDEIDMAKCGEYIDSFVDGMKAGISSKEADQ